TCPLDAFLYMVCKNKWLNELSKRKTEKVTIAGNNGYNELGEDVLKLAEDYSLEEARKNLLMDKLAMLSESCRQLLHLSWSGKSMEEVAGLLNVTYGYARKRKSECMAKVITLVKQSAEFDSLKW
ncbi:MAG: sigma-70 family RNA polymerase sigma factor, partial [Segetibacter sp.]